MALPACAKKISNPDPEGRPRIPCGQPAPHQVRSEDVHPVVYPVCDQHADEIATRKPTWLYRNAFAVEGGV